MRYGSKSALDDPELSALAWARYRRLMLWMGVVTVGVVALALGYLASDGGRLTVNLVIATVLGVSLTMMTGTGLMLLVFLSHGTGHDEEVQAELDRRDW